VLKQTAVGSVHPLGFQFDVVIRMHAASGHGCLVLLRGRRATAHVVQFMRLRGERRGRCSVHGTCGRDNKSGWRVEGKGGVELDPPFL
jgi:hypothetical protein